MKPCPRTLLERDYTRKNELGEADMKPRNPEPARQMAQLQLRLPAEYHAFIRTQSEQYGSSMNSEVLRAIRARMDVVEREKLQAYGDAAQEFAELTARLEKAESKNAELRALFRTLGEELK